MTERRVRVRFAPSPTGPLHIGGVRTALYNYLFAKKQGGDFILRIEDTDQTRFVPGAEDYIIEAMKWLGINPNEGIGFGDGPHAPYRQSERKEMYHKYAMQLIESGNAYYAFDTPEELETMRERLKASNVDAKYDPVTRSAMKNAMTLSEDEVKSRIENEEPYVIRFKMPRKEEVKFYDEIRGWVTVNTAQLDDKVLFKSDGMPTYHLANVVDDYLMQITHVIRGEEWLPSAPLHILLYKAFDWENVMPKFAHLPLLLKPEGNGKLSKRDGDRLGFPVFPLKWKDPITHEVSNGYKESGYLPEAVLNLLALLGWNPGNNLELMSKDQMVELFSLDRVSKHGAKFDQNKAKWFNQQYIRHTDNAILAEALKKEVLTNGLNFTDTYILRACELMKEKITFIGDLWSLGFFLFVAPQQFDATVIAKRWNEKSPIVLKSLIDKAKALTNFNATTFEDAYNDSLMQNEVAGKDFLQLLRVCLTGIAGGPPLFEIASLLGKEETVARLEKAIESNT